MISTGTQKALDLKQNSKLSKLLMQQFSNKIVGQEKAVQILIDTFESHQAGFSDSSKPAGSALFLGGTGTGKTHVCETLAEILFGNRRACVRIDCAEFQHSHEIAKLVGSPAGYLGHRETPAALDQKRLDKYHTTELKLSIVLFDEIEKASDALWDLLLGILDNASLTLGTNEVVNFSNTIIVMTSNLGSKEMTNRGIGFVEPTEEADNARLEKIALSAAKSKFTPEFMNRLQHVVMFQSLTEKQIEQVLDIELEELELRLCTANMNRIVGADPRMFEIAVSPSAKRRLVAEGYDKAYGARHLKRALDKLIQRPLAKMFNSGQILNGDVVVVDESGKDDFDFYSHNRTVVVPEENQ